MLGRIHGALIGALWIMSALPLPLAAQRRVPGSSIEAYHAAVGRAFPVSADDVGILAREAGVSAVRVLRAWESVGDFVLVHQRITR